MIPALELTALLIAAVSTAVLSASILETKARHRHVRVRLRDRGGFCD